MAYSDFTLDCIRRAFALSFAENADLFGAVPDVEIGPGLRTVLDENIPLALAIHTEKARSELIVAPVLVEMRRLLDRRVSLFSGIDFSVAPEQGLNGVVDFILSRSPEQLVLTAPALMLVEANDNLKSGLGPCIAEMVAAQLFNAHEGRDPAPVHGVVTTGSLWRFLRLDDSTVAIDAPEYYLDNLPKIMGILLALCTPASDNTP